MRLVVTVLGSRGKRIPLSPLSCSGNQARQLGFSFHTLSLWNLTYPLVYYPKKGSKQGSWELIWANIHIIRIKKPQDTAKISLPAPFANSCVSLKSGIFSGVLSGTSSKMIPMAWLSTTLHVMKESQEGVQWELLDKENLKNTEAEYRKNCVWGGILHEDRYEREKKNQQNFWLERIK